MNMWLPAGVYYDVIMAIKSVAVAQSIPRKILPLLIATQLNKRSSAEDMRQRFQLSVRKTAEQQVLPTNLHTSRDTMNKGYSSKHIISLLNTSTAGEIILVYLYSRKGFLDM